MPERTCVYTVLFGRYEELLEQPVAEESDIDFICFTDDPELTSTHWEIRLVEPLFVGDPARSSRHAKICPHVFLEDYDVSLYLDNSVLLTKSPEQVLGSLLPADHSIAALAHSFRNTVRDEFRAVLDSGYETEWVLEEQLEHYRRSYPEALGMQPLNGGVLFRRHMDPALIEAMNLWWFNVLRYSRRDQLSFRVALLQASVEAHILRLDMRDNAYWKWPASVGRNWTIGESSLFRPRDRKAEERVLEVSAEMAVVKAEVAELCSALAEKDEAAERGRLDATELESTISARDSLIVDLQREVASVAEDAKELSTANAALCEQIEAIRQSNSWRVTRVLRSAGDQIRRVRLKS